MKQQINRLRFSSSRTKTSHAGLWHLRGKCCTRRPFPFKWKCAVSRIQKSAQIFSRYPIESVSTWLIWRSSARGNLREILDSPKPPRQGDFRNKIIKTEQLQVNTILCFGILLHNDLQEYGCTQPPNVFMKFLMEVFLNCKSFWVSRESKFILTLLGNAFPAWIYSYELLWGWMKDTACTIYNSSWTLFTFSNSSTHSLSFSCHLKNI